MADSFRVERTGSGSPMMLLPGAGFGPAAWSAVRAALQQQHELHIISLAGFAGVPPIVPPLLNRWCEELAHYASALQPIVVGHSFGGTLGLAMVARFPSCARGAVSIDGFPHHASVTLPGASENERAAYTAAQTRFWHTADRAKLDSMFQRTLAVMVSREADALLDELRRSDPTSIAQAMSELFAADLRDDLSQISVPTMAILAGHDSARASIRAVDQFSALPEIDIRVVDGARHFVMVDQPTACADLLLEFSAKLLG